MSDLEVGQVLSLRIRFNNSGDISAVKHPYLIVDINHELNVIEIAQFDSLKGKAHKALFKSNKVVLQGDPPETVIDEDSFVQLDNIIRVENFDGIEALRRQTDKLSQDKLNGVLKVYRDYHNKYEIDENKNVYMDQEEITSLNK